ncbi:hypothetical protein SynMINOS11_01325 [Synechococcus sp. Minos11]|nr:hypothetical protein SynMINOS11_01325 [Synechococcus sp. Minos11]
MFEACIHCLTGNAAENSEKTGFLAFPNILFVCISCGLS